MTQVINFNELKSAFAPKSEKAEVASFNPSSEADNHNSEHQQDNIRSLEKSLQQAKDEINALQDTNQQLNEEKEKALNHIKWLNHEKSVAEKEATRSHDEKMRSVRLINQKNNDVLKLQRQLCDAQQLERQVSIRLSHKKADTTKIQAQVAQQQQRITELNQTIQTLLKENSALKQQHSIKAQITQLIGNRLKTLVESAQQRYTNLKEKYRKQDNVAAPVIKWRSVSRSLPTRKGIVLVRNGYDSDVAVYNPTNRTFKCVNNRTMVVKEWALSES